MVGKHLDPRQKRSITYLAVVDVSKVVESPTDADLVRVFLADLQMLTTADNCLLKFAHHLQGVAEVAGRFGFPQPVAHCSCQGEVVLVELLG